MGYSVKLGDSQAGSAARPKAPVAEGSRPPGLLIAGIVAAVVVIAAVVIFMLRPAAGNSAPALNDAQLQQKHAAEDQEDRRDLLRARRGTGGGMAAPGAGR